MKPPEIPDVEACRVLGCPSGGWRAELLVHNLMSEVTAGVWRVSSNDRTAVLKVVTCNVRKRDPRWAASTDPRHWNYWRREAEFYGSDLQRIFRDAGIDSPRLLDRVERSDGEVALWLEDVSGRRGDAWAGEDHVAVARALGRAQGRIHAIGLELPWTSRRFLRDYSAKPVDYGLLDDEPTWSLPLVAETLGEPVRAAGRMLRESCPWAIDWMERLPRTICHLDFWPMNLVLCDGGRSVAFDWAFTGDGALGEDVGNHVPDAALDLFVQPEDLRELDRETFAAYVTGLREAGCEVDARLVRMGVCASAAKYVWLLPMMLERAVDGRHHEYGGVALDDPREQYRRRGETIRFLASWIDEAKALAPRVERLV